jgi:hypothetical protein
MKTFRQILITCSALALAAGVAMAQDGGGRGQDGPGRWGGRDGHLGDGGPGQGMRRGGMHRSGMHHRRMHDPIVRLLDHQTLLHLTPAQVNSIISIDEKLRNDNKPLIERLMAMHTNRPERRGGDNEPGRSQPSAAQRDSVMSIMRTVHENVWRATAAADAVLAPEQLNTAGTLDHGAHAGMMMFRRPRPGPEMGPGASGGAPRGE